MIRIKVNGFLLPDSFSAISEAYQAIKAFCSGSLVAEWFFERT